MSKNLKIGFASHPFLSFVLLSFNLMGIGWIANLALQGPTGGTIGAVGSSVSPNSPVPAASAQGPRFNVKNYGAIGDAKKVARGGSTITTNGGSHVTESVLTPWVAGDVGKRIWCIGLSGLSALTPTIETITAFNSAGDITVSGVGNANASTSSACVWYTQKDTAAFQAAAMAAVNFVAPFQISLISETSSPGASYCPEGGYVLDGPAFIQTA